MEPVAAPIRQLLEVFRSELGDVSFPDVDASTLARATNETLAAAEAVAHAEAALAATRTALAQSQEALLAMAQQAHAYLRVYAEAHPELLPQVEAIALPRPARRSGAGATPESETMATPKRRGRPRKAPVAVELFEGAVVASA